MQRQASRLTPGGPGGAGHHYHLQRVQDDDIRRLNLPPSIPVSRDGEEGAGVYNLRLQQSNADARPDCYQAPPNRTVDSAGASGGLTVGPRSPPPQQQHHPQTSTTPAPPPPPPPPPPLLTRREVTVSLARVRSVTTGDDLADTTDAPDRSGRDSLSGGWRPTSPDLSSRLIIIPSTGGLLSPSPMSAPAAAASGAGAKRRSSSADSVRRLVARCSLLRFARRHAMTTVAKATTTMTTTSPSTMTLLVDPQKAFDGVDSGRQSPGGEDQEPEAPPWELPPNYVDMIFTKDPATIDDNKKEKIATKQQQQQQQRQRQQRQQEQRQQRQSQHCCFNS